MIEKMTRYDFVLLSSDKEGFLEQLRELGVVDIKRSDRAVDERSEQMLEGIRLAKKEIELVEAGTDAHLEELLSRLASQQELAAAVEPWGDFDPARFEELDPGPVRRPRGKDHPDCRKNGGAGPAGVQ